MKKGDRNLDKKELAIEVSDAHLETPGIGIQGKSFRRPFSCVDRTILSAGHQPSVFFAGGHFRELEAPNLLSYMHADLAQPTTQIDHNLIGRFGSQELFEILPFDFYASCRSVSVWEPVPGETKIEFETLYGQPTGWLREIGNADLHGWQLEYKPRKNIQRWRNSHTDEVQNEDPTGKPLTPFIIRGICASMLIEKRVASSNRQLPNSWKRLIMKFASVAAKTNLRGLDLFSAFKDLMKKNPTPILVDVRKLSLSVLQAEVRDLFPGQEFNSRQELEEKIANHFAQEQSVFNILLLENLSCLALLAMAQELGLNFKSVESRFDLVALVTEKILKS